MEFDTLLREAIRRTVREELAEIVREELKNGISDLVAEEVSRVLAGGLQPISGPAAGPPVTTEDEAGRVAPTSDEPDSGPDSADGDADRTVPNPITHEFIVKIAKEYRESVARGSSPVKDLMARYGRSRSSVSDWVRRARDAGELPETSQGKVKV